MIVDDLFRMWDGVRQRGDRMWTARCPVRFHDDFLSFRICRDGTILLMCHGGCMTTDVLKAVS